MSAFAELARLGTATVHEAAGRAPVVDVPLVQVVPGSSAAGPARTVRCGQFWASAGGMDPASANAAEGSRRTRRTERTIVHMPISGCRPSI